MEVWPLSFAPRIAAAVVRGVHDVAPVTSQEAAKVWDCQALPDCELRLLLYDIEVVALATRRCSADLLFGISCTAGCELPLLQCVA